MASKIIQASELAAGMQIVEGDGYLLDVREIVKSTETTITVKVGSDFSPARSTRDGFDVTLKKASRVQIFVAEES